MAFKFFAFCSLLAIANAGLATYTAPVHNVAIANPAVDAVASTQQNVVRSFGGTVSTYSKAVDTPYSSVRKTDTRISNNVYTPAVAKTVTYAAPVVAKSVTYAAPVVAKTLVAPAPTAAVYTHATPVYGKAPVYSYSSAPAPTIVSHVAASPNVYTHAAPVYAKAQASIVYSHAAPAVVSHVAPAVTKTISYTAPTVTKAVLTAPVPAPAPAVYTHAAPVYSSAPAPIVYSHAAAPAVTKTLNYATPVAATSYNHGPAATTYSHDGHGVSGYGSSQTIRYSPAEMVSHMSFDGFGTHWGF